MNAMELFEKAMLSYDDHVGSNDMFYYSLPYERDYDLCNTINIAPVSGNVIKFYQYKLEKPVIIYTDAVDTEYESLGVSDEEEFDEEFGDYEDENLESEGPAELSDEEMAALLTSDDAEVTDGTEDGVPDEVASEQGDEEVSDGVDDYDFTDFSAEEEQEPYVAPLDGDFPPVTADE